MEFAEQISEITEDHCFACFGTEGFVENVMENQEIPELFKKTFNLELEICDGYPKYLCETCRRKLSISTDFLAQVRSSIQYFKEFKALESSRQVSVKEEENFKDQISLSFETEVSEVGNDESFENFSSNEIKSDSESDNEPLIKLVKKKKRRKNTFNPKLKRIPLSVVEHTISEYREKCKENANCVLCDFKGLNLRNLSCHMIFKHREQKDLWCVRCNMMVDDLKNHKKTHTNRVWCKFCKKSVTRCHYMEHLKGHAGLEFHCRDCSKKFISQKALDEHTAQHKQQKPFQCIVCNKAFKLLKSLEDHVMTHGRYKCEVCEKNFEIPELLSSHLCCGKINKNDRVVETKKEECVEDNEEEVHHLVSSENYEGQLAAGETGHETNEHCSKDVDTKNEDSTIKVRPEIEVESLTCHFCQRTYKTAYKLQKHIEAHMGIFLAKCKYCDKGFSSKADLANHERVHTKEKPFICSACGKGFVSGATLRVHMKQHTGKPEECDLCHKRFCRKSELRLHMQKHRGERPFLCTDCGKSFAQKSHLTCHLTMHSEERPYSCTVCDRAFKKKELLKHHMKLHGEKKFKCSVCFYECHKRYRLQQHMKMHEGKTGTKMNACQLCTRSFSSTQLLNLHMGNAHNVIV